MTREEAKDEIYSYVHMEDIDSVHEFMDILYDDIESRVCENCRHYEPEYENEDYGICLDNKYTKNIFTDKDFGCNQFKRKLESK